MVGLGTMGRNFLLNIAEHGISGVGFDLDASKRELLLKEGAGMPVDVGIDMADFIAKLETPRNIMMLVPAGPIVDSVIADLLPHLEKDDLIIDGGNSHFTDTDRRIADLSAKNIGFMGVGVSGGEEGARHGASIMPGGRAIFTIVLSRRCRQFPPKLTASRASHTWAAAQPGILSKWCTTASSTA